MPLPMFSKTLQIDLPKYFYHYKWVIQRNQHLGMEWKNIPMEYFWASFSFPFFLLKSWALMYSNKSKKKKRQITIAFKHLGFSCFLLHCLQCSYRERVNIFGSGFAPWEILCFQQVILYVLTNYFTQSK